MFLERTELMKIFVTFTSCKKKTSWSCETSSWCTRLTQKYHSPGLCITLYPSFRRSSWWKTLWWALRWVLVSWSRTMTIDKKEERGLKKEVCRHQVLWVNWMFSYDFQTGQLSSALSGTLDVTFAWLPAGVTCFFVTETVLDWKGGNYKSILLWYKQYFLLLFGFLLFHFCICFLYFFHVLLLLTMMKIMKKSTNRHVIMQVTCQQRTTTTATTTDSTKYSRSLMECITGL